MGVGRGVVWSFQEETEQRDQSGTVLRWDQVGHGRVVAQMARILIGEHDDSMMDFGSLGVAIDFILGIRTVVLVKPQILAVEMKRTRHHSSYH